MAFPPIALATPYLKSEKIRALAVTSPERVAQLPEVPTVAEGGIADFDYSITYGVVMSSQTSKPQLRFFADRMLAITRQPDIQRQLLAQGLIPRQLVLGEFDAYIAHETEKLGKIVRAGNFKT